jgi:hypothetical protein
MRDSEQFADMMGWYALQGPLRAVGRRASRVAGMKQETKWEWLQEFRKKKLAGG